MDQILDIQLILDGNKLLVLDHTALPENANDPYYTYYYTVDVLLFKGAEYGSRILTKASIVKETVTHYLYDDGLYTHFKLSIPHVDYFLGKRGESLLGELFIFENKIYKILETPNTETVSDILSVSKEVIDILTAYSTVTDNSGSANEANESYFSPKKDVLNICNIRKCLVYLQRKMLMTGTQENSCSTSTSEQKKLDFLFGAVYVIEYLKETGSYAEANRIIDNLSSCGFLCDKEYHTINNCGCGA